VESSCSLGEERAVMNGACCGARRAHPQCHPRPPQRALLLACTRSTSSHALAMSVSTTSSVRSSSAMQSCMVMASRRVRKGQGH
jgi:hypothetical protein